MFGKKGRSPNRWEKTDDAPMHHRVTKGPQSGMRSKKSVQDITNTNCTESSSKEEDTTKDVHNTNFRSYVPEDYRQRLDEDVHGRQWRFVTFDGILVFGRQRKEDSSTVKQDPGEPHP